MGKNGEAIAVYSRKSRFTGKGESIGNQKELCRDYVRSVYGAAAGEKIQLFEDEGFSGGNLNRPGFQSMMDRVRNREFRAIVVYRLDRISRNISDFTGLIDELTRLDVAFVSIREQFDTSTPMGRAMMFIISVFSQLERETIAERIRDNMQELARTGRWLGGNTPTGYASESVSTVSLDGRARKACRLRILPEEAQVVRLIFDLYREKGSLTGVETELLRRHVRSRTGKEFTRFSIRGILTNPVYMAADGRARTYFGERGAEVCAPEEAFDGSRGIMAYNRTEQEKGKANVLLPVDRWILAVGDHPPLVSSEAWIETQALLERNGSGAFRQPRRNEALLTGLLFCACGSRMYPKLSGRTDGEGNPVWSYVCKRKSAKGCDRRNLPGLRADRAVVAEIGGLQEDAPTFLERMEKYRRSLGERQEDPSGVAGLRRQRRENERKIAGLLDAVSLAGESEAKLRLTRRLEELCAENSWIDRQLLEPEPRPGGEWVPVEAHRAFSAVLQGMTVQEKRKALEKLISRAVWDGETLDVTLGETH